MSSDQEAPVVPMVLIGATMLYVCGLALYSITRNKYRFEKKTAIEKLQILANNPQEGDLNHDGVFPDAYRITENGHKIPFYLVKTENGRDYVSRSFMEVLEKERAALLKEEIDARKVEYSEIERKLNESE